MASTTAVEGNYVYNYCTSTSTTFMSKFGVSSQYSDQGTQIGASFSGKLQ
jgi:hypothetical protein